MNDAFGMSLLQTLAYLYDDGRRNRERQRTFPSDSVEQRLALNVFHNHVWAITLSQPVIVDSYDVVVIDLAHGTRLALEACHCSFLRHGSEQHLNSHNLV